MLQDYWNTLTENYRKSITENKLGFIYIVEFYIAMKTNSHNYRTTWRKLTYVKY